MMVELFTGKPVFAGKNSLDQLARIVKVLGAPTGEDLEAMGQTSRKLKFNTASGAALAPPPEHPFSTILPPWTPLEAVDLIEKLLRYNPNKRLRPTEALRHPFFKDIFKQDLKLPPGVVLEETQLSVSPQITLPSNTVSNNGRPQPS